MQICHALNGGKKVIPNTNYREDGYCEHISASKVSGKSEKKVTIFDFYGCFWHGCKICYSNQRQQTKVPRTDQSMEELYTLTLKREQCICSLGFEHVSIWEHEFNKLLRENETAANFMKSLDLQTRLDPRMAFLGARVNSMKLHYAVNDVKKIHYLDFCSLYPYVNKYARYPVKEPKILTGNFGDISQYFGMAKIKVLPPRGLYHPLLPQKINGKLLFPLFQKFAELQNQKSANAVTKKEA